MEFSIISEMFEMMEKTTKRIELTNILVELLKKTPKKIIPNVVYYRELLDLISRV